MEGWDNGITATNPLEAFQAREGAVGKLNPRVAIVTGRIKTEGDARGFMVLQELS